MVGNGFQEVVMHHTPQGMQSGWLVCNSPHFPYCSWRQDWSCFFSNTYETFPFPQPFRYDNEWSHNANSLNTQGWSCKVPWTSACPVHSNISWVYPALLRAYLHFSKLAHGLEGPEHNASQKIWKYEEIQCFNVFLIPCHQLNCCPIQHEDIQWNAPIICPQLQLHLFQLLFATKSNSSSPEGLCSSTGAFVKLPHASSQNTISRLVSKTKRRPWCSRFQHGKDNLSAAVVQPVIASLPLEFKQLGACPAFHDSFLPGKKLVIAKLSRI